MFAYIKGIVEKIGIGYIELDNANIGYHIKVANPFDYVVGENKQIFLYQYIREDTNDLFGFQTNDEKELFIKLISVNGIGPKSALSILAAGSVTQVILAIDEGNANYLMRFPGIGLKTSQQIILDLRGKIDFFEKNKNNLNDVVEALMVLGYKKMEIDRVINKVEINAPTTQQIRQALNLMLK